MILGTIHWKDPALSLEIAATVSVTDSKVEVVCDSNLHATEDDCNQVYMRAFDMARAAVDSFCYTTGLGLTVVLEKVIKPNGIEHDILVQRPDLAANVTASMHWPPIAKTRLIIFSGCTQSFSATP